jgi:hypothetical protein
VNSGFWAMALADVTKAAPRMSSAPASKRSPSPSPSAMMPMPAKESSVPPQAMTEKRSERKAVANSAVRIGLTLMMKLAAPAETVSSP